MMKIFYCPYELVARVTVNSRKSHDSRRGALLRVEHEDGTIGYADCHPWEELGDLPLDEQINLLHKREVTPLTQRSLHFAQIDAIARMHNKNVFQDLIIPRSHWLISNLIKADPGAISEAINQEFDHFKIKLGGNLPSELDQLRKLDRIFSTGKAKLRFDFNQRLTQSNFEDTLKTLSTLDAVIDFYEDPFPFDNEQWAQVQSEYGVDLACDHQSQRAIGVPEAASVLVIKPAVQDEAIFLASLQKRQRLVITSYLDHPLGQLSAAYVAALCYAKNPDRIGVCGLLPHHVYQPNAFSEKLTTKGPDLIPPEGTGFGFNDLLQAQPWQVL
jgi:o-succinylbenzoate synthase